MVYNLRTTGQPIVGGSPLEAAVIAAKRQLVQHFAGLFALPDPAQAFRQQFSRFCAGIRPAGSHDDPAVQQFAVLGQVTAGNERTHGVPQQKTGDIGICFFQFQSMGVQVVDH